MDLFHYARDEKELQSYLGLGVRSGVGGLIRLLLLLLLRRLLLLLTPEGLLCETANISHDLV